MIINSVFFKINMFLLSLWLLFVCLIVMTFKLPSDFNAFDIDCLYSMVKNNPVSLGCILILIYLYFIYKYFKYRAFDGSGSGANIAILQCESIEYENLAFLTTYIIPLAGIDVNTTRGLIIVLILLIAVGIIHAKTDRFYTNPTLSLIGFRIYKVVLSDNTGLSRIAISVEKLSVGNSVNIKHLSGKKIYLLSIRQGEKK